MEILELVKNITIIVSTLAVGIGLSVLYILIFLSIKEIKKINEKIEYEREVLDEMEVEFKTFDPGQEFMIKLGNREEINILKQKQKIEKLEREKKNILEKVSIYKVFKK